MNSDYNCVLRISLNLALLIAFTTSAVGNINLELRPGDQTLGIGETLSLGLYAVSDDPEQNQTFAAMDVIISWNPLDLQLLGVDNTNGTPLLFSGFIQDPHGINESLPPQDGDGLYTALAPLGTPGVATPAGTLITTFQFTALDPAPTTLIQILEAAGNPPGATSVLDGVIPNWNVTGTLGSAVATIQCQACPGDLNLDYTVNLQDLAELLSYYGATSGVGPTEGDLDCDGDVDITDLAALLGGYGLNCP